MCSVFSFSKEGEKMRAELTKSGIVNCANPDEADHVILGIAYDVTSSGGKGANKGPTAVKKMLEYQIEPYVHSIGITACELAKIAWRDLGNLAKLTPAKMVEKVTGKIIKYFLKGKAVTVIGGEHSITIPVFKAYAQVDNPAEVTILHIDAHYDLRDIDEFRVKPYGQFAHCCVMRRAWDFGFHCFVQVGIRVHSFEEANFAQQNQFQVFEAGYQMEEPSRIVQSIQTQKVWISLDADGICPGDMPATGTPVGGGPNLDYVNELLYEVSLSHEITGVDVVEVAPPLGLTDLTAYNAAQIAYNTIAMRVARKLERR